MASIVIFGDITGGHFNPAVTIGVFTSLKEYARDWLFMILIIFAQVVGGFLAIALSYAGKYTYPTYHTPILAPWNPVTKTFDNSALVLEEYEEVFETTTSMHMG